MAFTIFQLRSWLSSVLPDRDSDRGASLIEYALLLVFICMVCLIAMTAIGQSTSGGINEGASGFANN